MKLKMIGLVPILVLFAFPGLAQKETKKATREICTCFGSIPTDTSASYIQGLATGCLVEGVTDHLDGLMEENQIEDLSDEGGRKLGDELASRLLKDCPPANNVFRIIDASHREK